MKKAIMVVLALSLVLSVVPAMAENTSQAPALQAMSNLSTAVPMTDQQLATVSGEGWWFKFPSVKQVNVSNNYQFIGSCYVAICANVNIVNQVNSNSSF